MLFFCGFCVLMFRILAAEACSANQQSAITLTETSGTISYIRNYLPVNAKCQWTMTASVGNVFRIDLWALFRSKSCTDNQYVRLYDGSSTASNLLTEAKCKDKIRSSHFYSSGRSVLLEVSTGTVVNTTLMDVEYQAQQECSMNSTLVAPKSPTEHNFSSPFYPVGIPRNTTCGWYIKAPENHVVMLQLTLVISHVLDPDKDSTEVFDVEGSELIPIQIPEDNGEKIYSKFRMVYVVFKSDNETTIYKNGIFAKYSAIKTVRSCSSANSKEANNNILLKDSSGTIETPGYPHGYPGNLITECYWKIIVPKGKVVRIEFTSFRLYERVRILDFEDEDDSAVITDSINGLNPRSVIQSGRKPSFYFLSTGNQLSIKVNGKAGNTGPGFIANYEAVPSASSGACILGKNTKVHMAGEGRGFSSPGYPSYPGEGSCTWNVTVSPGHFIKLTFWDIKPCWQNNVKVFDVTNSTRVLLGKFCSKSEKEVVYSRGSNVLVKFSSKRYLARSGGFFATYESIKAIPAEYSCESGRVTMTESSGEFASYGYPLSYSNDAKCSWRIESSVGHVVQLTFHSFYLQQSQDCEADYVEIKHGSYSWPTVIGKFCGSSSPGFIQVNDSNVYVEFKTDSSGKYPGFHASYKILPDPTMGPCKNPGQDNLIPLTGDTGTLFSPLYPRKFEESISCTWVITVPDGHFVKLRIKSFDLGMCDRSSLKIRDGQSASSNLLKSFCRWRFEKSVFSSSRHLWVQYSANDPVVGDMFFAVFEAVKQLPAPFACTAQNDRRKLESETGTLASYNYPLPYDDSLECVWLIYTDTDRKIELSFDFFNLSDSADCSEDYVEVRNGQFDTSDLAGRFCGSEKPSSITSDDWEMRVAFKSSGKTKYPGFKATYETKKTVGAILKIVGIVVGALSAVCTGIVACCKYGSCCKDDEPQIVQGSFRDEAESVPLQKEATSKV